MLAVQTKDINNKNQSILNYMSFFPDFNGAVHMNTEKHRGRDRTFCDTDALCHNCEDTLSMLLCFVNFTVWVMGYLVKE